MPELPEVETIRRSLSPLLMGKTVACFRRYTDEVFLNPKGLEMSGLTIATLRRRGKYLIIDLGSEEQTLLVHLRMTGKLLFREKNTRLEPSHLRAEFTFTDGSSLLFSDSRRFGRIWLLPWREVEGLPGLAALGPEPLSRDFRLADFHDALKKHPRQPIKSLLLAQSAVAGLGNIYCDEVLHRARVHPARLCGHLGAAEVERLHRLIPEILQEAIGLGGSSFRDYVNGLGGKGHFQLHLAVYQREGKACPACGRLIEKMVLGGRGTRYCPSCQIL